MNNAFLNVKCFDNSLVDSFFAFNNSIKEIRCVNKIDI